VLQTKADAQCDKLATIASVDNACDGPLHVFELFVESHQFKRTAPAFGVSFGGDSD